MQFHGPTNFAPMIQRAMSSASYGGFPTQQNQHFTVLLILTDGQCTDMPATINKIIEASQSHPLAIVIVGIGNADFSAMRRLDGDDAELRGSRGNSGRDIVQFVEWKPGMSPQQLTADVLSEVPRALVEYMVDRNIQPNAPISFGNAPLY